MNLKYQTIQTSKINVPGVNVGGGGIVALAKLAHTIVLEISEFGLKHTIERELKLMDGRIKLAMGKLSGVLVVAQTQEWEHPDPTGVRVKRFLSMHLGGSGNNYKTVLERYLMQKHLVQGPDEGWRYAEKHFLWVTRNLIPLT